MRRVVLTFFLVIGIFSQQAFAGLDVTAYSNLVRVVNPVVNKDGDPLDSEHEVRFSPVDFPERFRGLESGAVYRFGKSLEFRAGSYSGYNWWRNELAKIAGYPLITTTDTVGAKLEKRYDAAAWNAKAGPFWELINFSDAEGVIGPVACKKLYGDFLSYHKAAMQHHNSDFVESYKEWEQAFKLAAQNGAIEFH